jgi:hypothetical protein
LAEGRVRTGAWLAAVGGVLLIVSLFLDWYEYSVPPRGGEGGRNVATQSAWDGLERTDVYLCVLAVAALIGVVVLLGNWLRDSNAAQITIILIGVAAVILVLYRGLDPPAPVIFGVELDTSLKLGWFLALLASAGIVVGGAMAVIRRPTPEGDQGAVAPGAGAPAPAAEASAEGRAEPRPAQGGPQRPGPDA